MPEKADLETLPQIILHLLFAKSLRRRDLDTRIKNICNDLYNKYQKNVASAAASIDKALDLLEEYKLIERVETGGKSVYYELLPLGKEIQEGFLSDFGDVTKRRPETEIITLPSSILKEVEKDELVKEEIENLEQLSEKSKYSFENFPVPLVNKKTGEINVLFVTAHSKFEADIIQHTPREIEEFIKAGNPSDYSFIPKFVNALTFWSIKKQNELNLEPTIERNKILWKTDLQVNEKLLGDHNVIVMGAGNVNTITYTVLKDFSNCLPIYFRGGIDPEPRPTDHSMIYSRLSGKTWKYDNKEDEGAGLLIMLPNIYTNDRDEDGRPNKVIIVCAGLEIFGTQTGILALCKDEDKNGESLTNNSKDPDFPAKVVKGTIKWREIQNPIGFKNKTWDITDLVFLE